MTDPSPCHRESVGWPFLRWAGRRPGGAVEEHQLRLAAGAGRYRRLAGPRRVLHRAGLLDDAQLAAMSAALESLAEDVRSGAFVALPDDEDVHTALERGLIERAGADLGGRLRAGRSATTRSPPCCGCTCGVRGARSAGWSSTSSTRCWRRRSSTWASRCPAAPTSSMPSRSCSATTCSPTSGRCCAMSSDCATGTAARTPRPTGPVLSPAGSLGLDPAAVATDLGFSRPVENSIDGTAARDLAAEFAFVAAMTGVDISRLAEEVVLWSTKEFGFVRLDDAYSTGSSIMPQKKNPDVAELARGRPDGWSATSRGC